MNKGVIIALALFLAIIGCEKDNTNPEPDKNSNIELSLEIVHGNGQIGEYNSFLQDSLVLKVTDKKGKPVPKAPVSSEIRAGGGDISSNWVWTDTLGLAYVNWRMGCQSDYNELAVFLNDSISNKIDSVIFSATATLASGWGKSCGIDYTRQFGTIFREHNGTIFFANPEMIYTSDDGGISWLEYENMPSLTSRSDIFDIQFNSKGWMYLATEYDGVFYTEDNVSWNQINNGILNHSKPMTFLVEDESLFIAFDSDGLYRSTDNGQIWRKLLFNGKSYHGNSFINRHPDGSLYLFDNSDNLWHSRDNGDNWNLVDLDYKYRNYRVEDFIIDKDGNLCIGAGDATISIVSSKTYQGTMFSFYEQNHYSQHVEDIMIFDDIIYFTSGHLKPTDY